MTAPRSWWKVRPGQLSASVALLPLAMIVLVAYAGTVLWSLRVSLTDARTFPSDVYVGLAQYERLFHNERWLLSLNNLAVYGLLFIGLCMVVGLLLAVFIDQKVRGEGLLRTVFLYPYAMSFVATGLVWQWLLNPELGLQNAVQTLGFDGVQIDWIVDQDKVMYTIVLATVWQASGFVMALLLAGLRSIDAQIWNAARIDGIPTWQVYTFIVLPMLGESIATVFVLLLTATVKLFDAVVSMTQGGPGNASEVPAKFIMDHLFGRANLALASAGSVILLLSVLALVAPLLYARSRYQKRVGHP